MLSFRIIVVAAFLVGACSPKKPESGGGSPAGASGGTCAGLRLTVEESVPGRSTIAFHLDQGDVDPCSVNGYVVGDDSLKVEAVGGGDFVIANVPPGNHDVIIQGQSKTERVGDPSATNPEDIGGANLQSLVKVGLRVNDVVTAADEQTDLPAGFQLKEVGQIAGGARLEGQEIHSGILVNVPGTSFSAFTADDGSYVLTDVVPGDHDLDFSKDQFHSARIGAVTVEPKATTTVDDVLLRLNRGETGPIVSAADDQPASGDLTYDFSLIPTGAPVKMKIAFEPDCPNVEWQVFKSSGSIQIAASAAIKKGGYASVDVYICLADRDNTASTLKQTVTVDIFGNQGVPLFDMPTLTSRAYGPIVPLTNIQTTTTFATMHALIISNEADEAAALANPSAFRLQSAPLAGEMSVVLADDDLACGDYWIYFSLKNPEGYESQIAKRSVQYECWHKMAETGRPDAMLSKARVRWAGDRLVVFGDPYIPSAKFYQPSSRAWLDMGTTNQPAPLRRSPAGIWTGQSLLIYGGKNATYDPIWDGGLYRPETNSWTAIPEAPSLFRTNRENPTVLWLGDRLLVYGGNDGADPASGGVLYDPTPTTPVWVDMNTASEPSARENHVAVWTGTRFVVWGGEDASGTDLADGGRFDPISNSWLPITSTGALSARTRPGAVVVGSKVLIFGGLASGGDRIDAALYDPVADSWTPVANMPSVGYDFQDAFVVNDQVLVWYGRNIDGPFRLSLANGAPGTWSDLNPSGCTPAFDTGWIARLVGDKLAVWPPICAQKYVYFDVKTNAWNSMAPGGPEPVYSDSNFAAGDAGGRFYLYEIPQNDNDGAYGIGALGRTPLTFAWIKPGNRNTMVVHPGETVRLGYRIVNDSVAIKGGTLRIAKVVGATATASTAPLPGLAGNETRDIAAAESVAIAIPANAPYPSEVLVTLSYETLEGFTGEATLTLPVAP